MASIVSTALLPPQPRVFKQEAATATYRDAVRLDNNRLQRLSELRLTSDSKYLLKILLQIFFLYDSFYQSCTSVSVQVSCV